MGEHKTYYKADVLTQEKTCIVCGEKYNKPYKISQNQWCDRSVCSIACRGRLKTIKLLQKPKITIVCKTCGQEAVKPLYGYSASQFLSKKFCSNKCAQEARKIKDGITNYERSRRKRGVLKVGTPEWLAKIRSATKDAMHKPEIQFKLRQPRNPLTEEHRQKLSDSHAGKLPKNMQFGFNGRFPNVQRGYYTCSKGEMYFRSKWEANYALYLDFLQEKGEIKEWGYEVDVFVFEQIKFGTRSFLPDFKVFTPDGLHEYHEVKGYMDSKSKTKLKRFAKYYPDEKLILIDTPCYNDIKKKIGKMLNFY
jgi:hypothetical protein